METNHYPTWEELPKIDLYLDQVLLYVNQMTSSAIDPKDKGLTASMVNNYVKHGHVDKPIKKKYQRAQLARLIVITSLKNVFGISEIAKTLEVLTVNEAAQQKHYNDFVACMNGQEPAGAPEVIIAACRTLQLYQKTHELVTTLEGAAHDN